MKPSFDNPVPPCPGWKRRTYRLSRPVSEADIRALLGNEELYLRQTESGVRAVIHKYGLVEINLIIGESDAEIWQTPDRGAYPSEYVDALLATRF